MGFGPFNRSLKIRESMESPIPSVGAHLGVWRFILSHSPTFTFSKAWNVILGFHSWLALLQVFALVVNPRLKLRHFFFGAKYLQTIAIFNT